MVLGVGASCGGGGLFEDDGDGDVGFVEFDSSPVPLFPPASVDNCAR